MTDYQTTPPGYPTTPRYPATPEQPTTAFAPPGDDYANPSDGDASAKNKAADAAQAGKQAAGDVAQTAVEHGKEVASEAQQQARNLVGEARSQLQDHAHEQHRNAVSNLRSLGDELHSMAGNGQQDGPAAQLVRQAGDRTHAAADWLDGRQPQDVLTEVGNFARRRPGAFLLGALAAGVVAGRLTRGTIAAHQDDSNGSDASTGTPAAADPAATTGYGQTTDYGQPGGYGQTTGSYEPPAAGGLA